MSLVCLFENKGVRFINIARILRDPEIVKSVSTSSVKFVGSVVAQKLTSCLSNKLFNFDNLVNVLDFYVFLTNPHSLPCKCNNSPFTDVHGKDIVTGDIRIIKNNVLKKHFIKEPIYREKKRLQILIKAKYCILEDLDNCISCFCRKNVLIKLSFRNGQKLLPIRKIKESLIQQISYIHIST